MFLVRVYHAAGLIPDIDPRPYPRGWYLRDSRYLALIAPYVVPRVGLPAPADVALFQIGRAPAHAAIVVAWPHVIHAHAEDGVIKDRADGNDLAERFVSAWTVRGLA
jgi:hypothetical protein